ncbi:MAG: CCA tRNA nucleotidyltransferase, partial [Anaerolineae bacterium]|nr:CCA tRNA nucleotidyltransferase [Anaerolineae bacterium]
MSFPEYDLTPRLPEFRTLLWPDVVLDLQDAIRELDVKQPLYIVGGAVRDAFLHRPVKDIDLATPQNAIKLARKITNHFDADLFVMDAERGVARVLLDTADGRLVIDVAQFRGDDLLSDLLGRDFTINAMAVDLQGDLGLLIDPLKGGEDAVAKVIRRCAEVSIADDPLRGLRAIRQSVQLGFRIEPSTSADIRAEAANLVRISPERLRDEFFKMLALQRPTMALRSSQYLGLLEHVLPEVNQLVGKSAPEQGIPDLWSYTLEACQRMERILTTVSYRRTDNTAATFDMGMLAIQFDRYRQQLNDYLDTEWPEERQQWALLMFGTLLHFVAETPEEAAEIAIGAANDLRLSNPEKKRLRQMITDYRASLELPRESGELLLHRYWYSLEQGGVDALLLGLAHYLAWINVELNQDTWLLFIERARHALEAYYKRYSEVVSPQLFVDGSVLMEELNIKGGPIVGDLLRLIFCCRIYPRMGFGFTG